MWAQAGSQDSVLLSFPPKSFIPFEVSSNVGVCLEFKPIWYSEAAGLLCYQQGSLSMRAGKGQGEGQECKPTMPLPPCQRLITAHIKKCLCL